jgi:hypothetical protein
MMLAHLAALCGLTTLAACMIAGGTAGPRGAEPAPVCVLDLTQDATGFTLAGAVGGNGPADWVLTATATDGGVRIVQSGAVPAAGPAGQATLPGRADAYDLGFSVTRAGQTTACPLRMR